MKAYKAVRGTLQMGYGGDQHNVELFLVIPDAGIKIEYSQYDFMVLGIDKKRQEVSLAGRVSVLSDKEFPLGSNLMKLNEMPLDEWAQYMHTQDTTGAEYAAVECEIPEVLVADLKSIMQMEEIKKRADSGLREIILGKPKQAEAA